VRKKELVKLLENFKDDDEVVVCHNRLDDGFDQYFISGVDEVENASGRCCGVFVDNVVHESLKDVKARLYRETLNCYDAYSEEGNEFSMFEDFVTFVVSFEPGRQIVNMYLEGDRDDR